MKDFTVGAKVPGKDGAEDMIAQVTVKAPENLDEAGQMFGGNAVVSNALANWKVVLQSAIRSGLKRGEDQAALQARLGSAKMGVAVTKDAVDPKAAFLAQFAAASPADRKKMIAELTEKAASMAG